MTGATVAACDVVLRSRSHVALSGVSFSLSAGVTGLLGPNGAGKTSLLRILATATVQDSGRLTVLDNDPTSAEDRLDIRRRLGCLPQNPGLHPTFTVFESGWRWPRPCWAIPNC